jgi:uncharacterized membrane-anchored protein
MNRDRLDQILQEAAVAAARPAYDGRPWPVVLLTALGAWLAALPLLLMVGLLLIDTIKHGAGAYIVGTVILLAAIVVLRASTVPLFVEQLAIPVLLVGGSTLSLGLFRDLSTPQAAAVLAVITSAVAWTIPRNWLRVLLGATTAAMAIIAFMPDHDWRWFGYHQWGAVWGALHASFALWIIAHLVQQTALNDGKTAGHAAALESVSIGWVLITLAGLALWSGSTFLLPTGLGPGSTLDSGSTPLPAMSVALAAGGAAWIAHSWPTLRQWWSAGVVLVLLGLAWFMPSLGAVLLVLAFCAASGRWRVAAAAGAAAVWIIGSVYYQLSWPLATKASLLVGAGIALGALSWLALRGNPASGTALAEPSIAEALLNAPCEAPVAAPSDSRILKAAIASSLLAVLVVANAGIWQKESLIAHGQAVYVELAPVDPRSLMQGDYMQLNFNMPQDVQENAGRLLNSERPRVVAKRDGRGIATLVRLHDGTARLAPDEFLLELTPKNGRWALASDAWFFKEGDGERWAKAKYGEFRVGADGQALLVGLRGAKLEPL